MNFRTRQKHYKDKHPAPMPQEEWVIIENTHEPIIYFKNIFSYEESTKKLAGECRELFSSKEFISFELKKIEEKGCSLTRILVQVDWKIGDRVYSEPLEFGCVYRDSKENVALPWRNNGRWILIPWKIQGLYKL